MAMGISSSPVTDFDFSSAPSSPVWTSPCTPRRLGDCFISAPSSPTQLFNQYDGESSMPKSPRTTTRNHGDDEGDGFTFDFSVDLEKTSRPAEELFDGGKIKPLKPPPRLKVDDFNQKSPRFLSPKSPFSQGKKLIREAFSPRKQKVDLDRDPFATAIETSRNNREHGRGREKVQDFTLRNSSRRATRSLSPYRVSEYRWEEEERKKKHEPTTSSKGSSRKWRLRDLLLFRNASEGRASDKDPLRKYSASFFKKPEENKNSGACRRKVSVHELH
ncbi:uncharacterized protein LOC120218364 isoform X1 [Hibiscus syriacus]|uniref:uncharacterized protein LOC120218364 isoform X1 n=1 Tax=Hibiscus syriacus TaxID=106335 RepID=UPI001923CA58|nr:uncharacterized protein LOC120218364 isoform X1 [Hibiscus syriacus]